MELSIVACIKHTRLNLRLTMFTIQRLFQSTSICLSLRMDLRGLLMRKNYSKSILPTPIEESDSTGSSRFNEFLIDYARQNQATTSFITLLKQLHSNANVQLPYVLPHDTAGRKKNDTAPSDLSNGIVTIAHILPSSNKVILASGFAVLDGRLLVTCAHTFFQAAHHLAATELDQQSQSIAITHCGELIRVASVATHLVSADLAVLRLVEDARITSFSVDPYPAPVSTRLLSYDFVAASLSSTFLPTISHAWQPAEVLFYKGQCGQEVATGTYDELSSMMYSHPPTGGSSGGPILSKETRSVVGIVRGSEVSYANRKRMGFAIPSECLLEAFKLPGMPDSLK